MGEPRVQLLTLEPEGRGVAVWNGRERRHVREPLALEDTFAFAGELGPVIRTVCSRPLARWRFWHTRRGLVRANRATRAVLRQHSGLLGESPPVTLQARHAALERIAAWCVAQGIPFKGSAGSLGMALFTKRFAPRFGPLRGRLQEDELIRPALYGGRAEAFHKGPYDARCCLVDRSGAYCAVLRDVAVPYPFDYVLGVNLRAPGVTECTITETAEFPVLASRSSNTFPRGEKRGTWTNAEIGRALDHGAKLKRVHGGLHYLANTRALRPLGEFLAEERMRVAAEPVLNTLLKMIPNALVGRFAAAPSVCVNRLEASDWRNHPRFLSAVRVGEGVLSVELASGRRPMWYAAAWSAAVLAAQRLELHEQLVSWHRAGYTPLACDTDGIVLGVGRRPLPTFTRSGIGEMRVSWVAERCVIQGPKTYVAATAEGPVGRRAGVKRDQPDRLELSA